MAQKEQMKEKDKQIQNLDELRKLRQNLSDDLYGNMEQTQQELKSKEKTKNIKSSLSKLDKGIQDFTAYKGNIGDLVSGLSSDLVGYVDFVKKSKNYTFKENFFKTFLFSPTKAENMRTARLRTQNPRENLNTVMKYAQGLVKELLETKIVATNVYTQLETNTELIAQKINVYQPQEEALKAKLDSMQKQYEEMDEEFKNADASRQGELATQKTAFHRELLKVQEEYDEVFTTYRIAQESLKDSEISRDSFREMMRNLGIQAKMIEEKMDDVAQIYKAAPEAIKIMMTTKGTSKVDQAINYSTTASVDMILTASEGVSDETLKRQEIPVTPPEQVYEMVERVTSMIKDITERTDQIVENARKSQNERYAPAE